MTNISYAPAAVAAAALLACSCASPRSAGPATTPATPPATPGCDVARDHAAIVAMAGEFDVTFAFEETEALTEGYQPRPRHQTDGQEVVEILESSAHKVVLQHVLLLEGADGAATPLKHWRQDWTFEDAQLVEYRGHDTWERRALAPAEVGCTWSQAVFEVHDGPRYESVGRWVHDADRSTWTSAETWRPLPRREHTKRKDYDVLVGTNRHIVTPDGWQHDQDNVKVVLADGRRLVREHGDNRYVRTTLAQAAVARTYLRTTASFWTAVRTEWASLASQQPRFTLHTDVDGELLYEILFPLAEATRGLDPAAQQAQIHDAIAKYVRRD